MKRFLPICVLVLVMSLATTVYAEQVTLRVLSYTTEPALTTQDQIFAEFQKANPDIKLLVDRVPFNELYRKIAISVASDNPPDVIYVDGPMTQSYAYNKIIIPLDTYYTEEELADFIPASIEEGSFQGRLYSIPERQSATAIYYNTDYTDKAGLKPPTSLEDTWTWDEWLDALKKVTQRDASGRVNVWGFTQISKYRLYSDYSFIRSAGEAGSPTYLGISPDQTTVSGYLNSPEAIEAFKAWQDLHQTHKVAPVQQSPDMFETGLSVFHQAPDIVTGRLNQYFPDLNWAVMPQPYFKTPIVHTGSFHWGIARQSDHVDEAVRFIKFITDEENSLKSYLGIGQLPARFSVFEKTPDYDVFPTNIFYLSMVEFGAPRPQTPGFLEYEEIMSRVLQDIVVGGDVESILATAVRQIDRQLAKYNR